MDWKVVAITDTHNQHEALTLDEKLPEGDVIIHAGDATNKGKLDELIPFLDWFGNLPYKYKVYVPGNHDFHVDDALVRILCRDQDIIYLCNDGKYLQAEGKRDLLIYGAPVHPNFKDDTKDLGDLGAEDIPDGLDILITHVPPYGIFDEVCENFKQKYLGNYQLLQAVGNKKPKYHVFGHVHPGYGKKNWGDTIYINACICNNHLIPINLPIVFEL